jgi:hypothetical protein
VDYGGWPGLADTDGVGAGLGPHNRARWTSEEKPLGNCFYSRRCGCSGGPDRRLSGLRSCFPAGRASCRRTRHTCGTTASGSIRRRGEDYLGLAEYWVAMSVRDVDARALDDATHAEYDDRVAGVIFEEPSEGFALVAFQIRAPDNESHPNAAHVQAMDAYDKLRRNARLDEDASPMMVTTVRLRRMPAMSASAFDALPPPRATRRVASLPYQRLLLKARNQYAMGRHGQGQYDAATVVANAACEVAITEAMQRLIAVHASRLQLALEGLIGNSRYSLNDPRVANLWDALAEDEIRKADFWEGYQRHLKRRNGVVHAGKSVSRDEADESIDVAQDVCDHVTDRSI